MFSPRAVSLLTLLVLVFGCGGKDKPPMNEPDDGGDGEASAGECTAVRSDPAGEGSSGDTNPSPEDDATELTFDATDVPVDGTTFPLGVQSGSVTASSVVLWAMGDPEATLEVLVWRAHDDAGKVWLAHQGPAGADAESEIAKVLVDGLAANTIYEYAFFRLDGETREGRTNTGRFRTAPSAGARIKLQIGATTCVGSESESTLADVLPFPALTVIGDAQPDVLLHLGDEAYNDGMDTLAQYRASWVKTLEQQGYRDMLASSSMYGTWDDHEVADNWNDPSENVSAARVERARQAYDEFSATLRSTDDPIWTSYQWGDTVEFIVLDLRSERVWETRGTPDATFVSDAQMTFLKDRLKNSTAHFKLVLSSVNMTNMPPGPGWDIPLGRDDRWEGFGAQREEVLDHIVENNIDNVWFLAGDIHMGFVGRLEADGHPYARMWEITVGPGASSVNPIAAAVELGLIDHELAFPCNQFVFGHGRSEVATFLELDPDADTVRVQFIDGETNEVMFDQVMRQDDE